MKKIIRKSLLVLLSLCMIISLPSCEEKEEIHDEAWYAKQIYIDRIAVEHTDSLDDGLKLKIVITENVDKKFKFISITGKFYDKNGNPVDENKRSDLFIREEDIKKLHKQKISVEIEDCYLTPESNKYLQDLFNYKDTLADIDTFRIEAIVIGYKTEEVLTIENNELDYVISPNAYNNDYDEYTIEMKKIQLEDIF